MCTLLIALIFFSSNLMCNEHGACFGHALDSRPAQSKDDCNRLCNLADGCSWFTFYPSNGQCMMINGKRFLGISLVLMIIGDCSHAHRSSMSDRGHLLHRLQAWTKVLLKICCYRKTNHNIFSERELQANSYWCSGSSV